MYNIYPIVRVQYVYVQLNTKVEWILGSLKRWFISSQFLLENFDLGRQFTLLKVGCLQFLFQNLVFLLKVCGSQNNLVFLQSLRLSGPSRSLFVLLSLLPVPVILHLLGHCVLLPLLDDRLRSEFLHVEVPCLGIKVQSRNRGQCDVLRGEVEVHLEFSLALSLATKY